MTYEEQLQTPQWYHKRDEILERDDYCCQDCLRGKNRPSDRLELHVHHRYYIDGLKAWEYPNELLITLCKDCHGKFHGFIPDLREERIKPTFVYGDLKFDSRPIKHIRDVIMDYIKSLQNGQ